MDCVTELAAARASAAAQRQRDDDLGEIVAALGCVGFVLTLHWAGDSVGIGAMTPALVALGIGMGLTMAPFFDIVLAGVEEHESGSASGALSSVQQLGGAFGIALLGTMFFHVLDGPHAGTRVGAFRDAAGSALFVGAGLLVAAFVLTLLLPRRARD